MTDESTDQIKIGDTVTWVEFKGTKIKELQFEGKVVGLKDENSGYMVEYFRPALAWVSEDKITKVEPAALTSERGES